MTGVPVVDSHQHFWLRDALTDQAWRAPDDHRVLDREFRPVDLSPELTRAGVESTVLVQSVDTAEENRRLAAFSESARFVAGIVAWLPLRDATAATAELEALDAVALARGVRCLIGRDPLDWLGTRQSTEVLKAIASRGLSWDVVPVTEEQVFAIEAVAARLPELTVVIDHLARPPLEAGGWEPWAERVTRLGCLPNVVMKLSVGVDVLTAWRAWDVDVLAPYVRHALEQFGPARCMLASNWPVVLLKRDYVGAWRDLDAVVRDTGLGNEDLAQVRGGTTRRVYRLTDHDLDRHDDRDRDRPRSRGG